MTKRPISVGKARVVPRWRKSGWMFTTLCLLLVDSAIAADWGAFMRGAAQGMADYQRQQIEYERELEHQQRMLELQHQLEMRRIQLQEQAREAELRHQQQLEAEAREREHATQEAAEAKLWNKLLEQKARQAPVIKQSSLLDKSIRDWRRLVSTDEFSDWFWQQPNEVQVLADSKNAKDAIALINKFNSRDHNQ